MNKSKIGQVFLKDKNIKLKMCNELEKVICNYNIKNFVEVGLGEGDMTSFLLKSFNNYKFFGVEVDPHLAVLVDNKYGEEMIVYNEDFLSVSLEEIEEGILFSNVPYQLTSSFIKRIVEIVKKPDFNVVALTIQKEAFERLIKNNNYIFYSFKHFYKLEKKLPITRQCFKPIPNVDSIFSIWTRKESEFENNSKLFLEAVQILNNKKNKTIKNNLLMTNTPLDIIDTEFQSNRFNQLDEVKQHNLIKKIIDYKIKMSN